jgi:hypothetical protein
MPLEWPLSWKATLAWAFVTAVAITIMVVAPKQRAWPPPRPQAAVVVSSYAEPMAGGAAGGGCTIGGVVATVRLKSGQMVSAATYQYGYAMVHPGALVTVLSSRPLCGPATYTILHGGSPRSAMERTRHARR